MRPFFSWLLLLCLGAGFALAAPIAQGWDDLDAPALDAVDVRQVRRDVIALRDGRSTASIRLESRERVVWQGAQGRVGVVLTDRRALMISRDSAGWGEARLQHEDGAPVVHLGGRIALVVTERRLLWQGSGGPFQALRLGAGERLVLADAREAVAIAVTNRRVIGFAGARAVSSERSLRAQERFHALRVLGASGSVETSKRFLVFSGSKGTWSAERLSLR